MRALCYDIGVVQPIRVLGKVDGVTKSGAATHHAKTVLQLHPLCRLKPDGGVLNVVRDVRPTEFGVAVLVDRGGRGLVRGARVGGDLRLPHFQEHKIYTGIGRRGSEKIDTVAGIAIDNPGPGDRDYPPVDIGPHKGS